VNQNLLYIVARHNFDRIYGDRRFDWIDEDWVDAVVAEGARLPGRDLDHDHVVQHDHAVGAAAPARRTRSRSGSKTKMAEMAARTRGRTPR
jgi:hypothetical protein